MRAQWVRGANRYLIYARTAGPEVKASKAVSLFYVERGMAGFSLGQRLQKGEARRAVDGVCSHLQL